MWIPSLRKQVLYALTLLITTQITAKPVHPALSDYDTFKLIDADLANLPKKERENVRYISLGFLGPDVSEERLAAYRYGISKFLNSLSWSSKMHPPAIVPGSKGLLLRITPNAYNVKRDSLNIRKSEVYDDPAPKRIGFSVKWWDRIAEEYPYYVEFGNRKLEQRVYKATGTDRNSSRDKIDSSYEIGTPVMRADYFIHAAGSGSMYRQIMGLDESLDDFEEDILGQNKSDRISDREPILRAGFLASGVTRHHRAIERHPISEYRHAALWTTYDFSEGSSIGLVESPIGPDYSLSSSEEDDIDSDHVFLHEAGETIFTLPNGLHAYWLQAADSNDAVDEAPIDIAKDPRRGQVTSAVACMDCHAGGLIPRVDQIRPMVEANPKEFNRTELSFIRYAYKKVGKRDPLAKAFERDQARFNAALAKVQIPGDITFPGVSQAKIEPITHLYDRYRFNRVNLAILAQEMGISKTALQRRMQAVPARKLPSFAQFLLAGEVVQRSDVENAYEKLAEVLKLGEFQVRACKGTFASN